MGEICQRTAMHRRFFMFFLSDIKVCEICFTQLISFLKNPEFQSKQLCEIRQRTATHMQFSSSFFQVEKCV